MSTHSKSPPPTQSDTESAASDDDNRANPVLESTHSNAPQAGLPPATFLPSENPSDNPSPNHHLTHTPSINASITLPNNAPKTAPIPARIDAPILITPEKLNPANAVEYPQEFDDGDHPITEEDLAESPFINRKPTSVVIQSMEAANTWPLSKAKKKDMRLVGYKEELLEMAGYLAKHEDIDEEDDYQDDEELDEFGVRGLNYNDDGFEDGGLGFGAFGYSEGNFEEENFGFPHGENETELKIGGVLSPVDEVDGNEGSDSDSRGTNDADKYNKSNGTNSSGDNHDHHVHVSGVEEKCTTSAIEIRSITPTDSEGITGDRRVAM
jgi:hypothetical protein